MSEYLLIESRDPFDCAEVANDYALASGLAKAGNDTILFLVQNGVFPVRGETPGDALKRLLDDGVEVVCDAFSVRERGIRDLVAGVDVADIEVVVEHMANRSKVIWL